MKRLSEEQIQNIVEHLKTSKPLPEEYRWLLFKGNKNERIIYFGTGKKKTLIKGWKGYFRLEGETEFLQFALDAGLGGRNPQGFGMIEVIGK